MEVKLQYCVTFGMGDGSDMIDFEIELNEEEAKIYKREAMLLNSFEENEKLEPILESLYERLEEEETEMLSEYEDFEEDPFESGMYNMTIEFVDPNEGRDVFEDEVVETLIFLLTEEEVQYDDLFIYFDNLKCRDVDVDFGKVFNKVVEKLNVSLDENLLKESFGRHWSILIK